MANARWFYHGDINPENGGFWYRLDNWQYGYADFVRITPCSDAGGPDNQFWIESGSVYGLDDEKRIKQAMNSCGWIPDEITGAARKHAIVQAMLGYGYNDQDLSELVQVGKHANHCSASFGRSVPHKVLRAGSDIARYVRREFLRNA